ncbi:hypothetical protein ACT3UJ_02430 [Halomonas sp. 86]|uniref:hypothetical protein n=1 Tax=unclassified Halomonas TaxID=2609666 RepID=UPI0040342D4D
MAYAASSRLEIIIDSATGERRLRELESRLDGVDRRGDQATRRMAGFSGELKLLRAAAAPIAGVLAGMFAGRTLKSQIDYADQLQKTNLRIGASVEALSQYNHVASLSGVQFNQLTTAWQRQTRRISEAAQGTGAAKDALQALNLSAQELNNLAPEEQFELIAEAMNGVENAADRTAMAMKIWDTEGVSLLQITSQGTDAIRQMRDEADRLGLTISQETANSMAEYNDEMERLRQVSTGVARQLTAEFVPSITSGLQSTSEWVNEIGGASRIIDEMQDVLTATAVVLAGRYSGALASSAADMAKRTAASRASAKAEIASAQATVRRTGAEKQAAMAFLSTARLEEQATRGTAAHAFALDNLSRARGQAATAAGAHTTSVNAEAAAMSRGAAAAGLLGSALALAGGPAGVIVMAGAAAYYFRDSLGFASAAARETREEVDQLTGSIEGLTRAQYENQWRELYNNMADARAEAERLQNQIEDLQDQASRESVMYQGRGGAASSQIVRLQAELQEQLRVLEAAEEGVNRYKQAWEDFQKSQITGASIFRPLTQWLFDTGKAAGGTNREFDALNYTLGTGGEGWDDYISKLRGARDVLGMTAAQAASYAAQQQGFTGIYAEMAGAVAGQTNALEDYRQAVEQGNSVEAQAHLDRARRFAEAEAMVQAQLLNMETLTNLLKGVQTELSAVALTSALTVADAGGAGAAYVANALRAINERAAAIQRTTTITQTNTAANRDAATALREAENEAKRFTDRLQSLTDRLYPLEASQRTYREEQELLTLALAKGEIGVMRYLDALGKLEAAQRSTQTASAAYGQGFGSEIGARGDVGSPTDPLASQGEDDYWAKWLESAEVALTDFDQLSANVAENFQRSFGNAFESMVFDSESAGDALRGMTEGIARSTVNALGQMAGQWLAYQAVQLAVGKTTQAGAATALTANAQAGVFQAGINAYSSTAAIPIVGPAAAPAAMMAAMAATEPLAAAVSASALTGMAHDGIGAIPKEGTWLLDKGERVLSNPQADRLDKYLDRTDRQGRGGNSTTNTYHVNVDARGSSDPAETRRQARLGAEEALRQTQRDFERNGPLRRTLNV